MDFLGVFGRWQLQRERVLRDHQDPLAHHDRLLVRRYRLPRVVIMDIVDVVRADHQRPTMRSRALSPELQVVLALQFYATASFFGVTGDALGASKSSVSRAVHSVSRSIIRHLSSDAIHFPVSDNELRQQNQQFYEVAHLPRVVGVIDCTHVALRRPFQNENVFVNRKGYHSINVQGVCNHGMTFSNVVIRWPGSTHDSYVWQNCSLKQQFVRGDYGDNYLLGDSGYPLRPFLVVPFLQPTTPQERAFNSALKRTRVTVECAFGLLKMRFRCLDRSGGALQIQPDRVCNIVHACSILHNIAVTRGLPLPAGMDNHAAILLERHQQVPIVATQPQRGDHLIAGRQTRQQLVDLF